MNKLLLLICCIFSVCTTLSYGQTDVLGNASSYAVLASTQINNNGFSGITGNVGVSPGSTINGEAGLVVNNGKIEKNTTSAVNAQQDALVAYNALYAKTPAQPLDNNLGSSMLPLGPGTYKITGDASFKGVLTLTGNGDVDATFVFIVDGNLLTDAPAAGVLAMNGAQPRNIYWIVTGDVNLGGSTGFQGTILAQGDITLGSGVVVIGRVQTIKGEVNLNYNNIFLPNVVVTDLKVSKTAAEGTYVLGSEVTYTITATNNGPGTATDVIVRENVPAGLEFVRVESSSQGSYDNGTHIWDVGTLQNGQSATLKLVFKVVATGELRNGVTIIGRDPDPNPGDNTGEDPIIVPEPAANLQVTKSASAGPHRVGDNITYTIVATNNGPYAAKDVLVTDVLPAGLQYQSHTVTKGAYDPATGKYTVGDLADDESVTLTIVAKIVSAGPIVNVATISSPDLPDPEPGDNTDEEPVDVICDDPGLAINGEATVCEDQEVTYTVTEVIGGTYTYTLPAGFTEVSRTATTITVKAGNAGGELQVKVKDQCGNEYTTTKTIAVTPKLATPTISGAVEACANASGIVYTITNAVDGVTYEWIVTGDVTLTASDATTATISVGAAGGTIAVKASNSCFESTSAASTISITPLPAKPAFVSSSAEVCNGSNTTYEVSAVAGATGYTWTLPQGWTIVSGEGTNKITVKAGTTGGDITVTADNACGSSEAATIAITVKDVPAAPAAISGTASGCIGTTLTFSIDAVDGATNYNWTLPQGWTFVSGQNTPTIEVTVGDNAGNITVSVTNSCGAGNAASIAVTPIAKPAMPTIAGPAQACSGSEGNTYTIAEVPGATGYTWTVPAGWTIISGEGTTSITVKAGTAGGNVTVTANNSCGSSAVATYAVTTSDVPAAPATINGSATACTGSTITYSVSPVDGAIAYNWNLPTGWSIISGENTPTIVVQVGDQAGNVSVSVTNNCGTGAAASIAVTPTLIPAQLTITGNGSMCAGEEATFVIPQIAGVTYTYTLPAGFTEVSRTATAITVKAGNTGGTLELKAKDICGNEYTVTKTIAVTTKPVITLSGPTQACANSEGLTYTVTGAGEGVTYEWVVTGGLTLTSDPGAATATIKAGTTGGTISVKVKNSCFESDPATTTITILPVPVKPTTIAGASEVCAGTTPTYEISPVAGATGYTWSVPQGWTIISGQGTTKLTVTAGATSGNVTVTADNECGSSEAANFAIAASDVPATATITGNSGACIGATLTYSVTPVAGATNYNWTLPTGWSFVSGQNTPTIEVTVGDQAGNVTVSITNSCGTSAAASIAVAPSIKPATPTITGPAETCAGTEGNVYSIATVDGATNYTWSVPTGWTIVSGQGTNSIAVTAGETDGEVSVIVTNSCGDSEAGKVAVNTTVAPAFAGPITDNSTLCGGLTYSIAEVAGATGYTWTVPAGCTIVSGQGTTSIKVTAANGTTTGDIKVVALTGGCSSPEALIPLDMTKVDGNLNFPKAFSPNGDGKNDAWVISNLEKYMGSEVTIFNRYGTEVYKKKNYQNDWAGNGLEQGTYFYKATVKLCDGKDQVFTGYVTIFR